MKLKISFLLFTILCIGCNGKKKSTEIIEASKPNQYITVLGISQDAGYPHIGCQKECCANYFNGINKRKSVVSLGLVDQENKQKWLFECNSRYGYSIGRFRATSFKNSYNY